MQPTFSGHFALKLLTTEVMLNVVILQDRCAVNLVAYEPVRRTCRNPGNRGLSAMVNDVKRLDCAAQIADVSCLPRKSGDPRFAALPQLGRKRGVLANFAG